MRTLHTVAELRSALAQPRREGRRVGLVPTMGAFHDGHRSLMRRARDECGLVVVSLFVNPAQFNEQSDLDTYPRDERRDAMIAAEENVDLLFAPTAAEMYPRGFATTVHVGGVASGLEGTQRGPGHFDGVATIVTKLFTIVAPDVAYFGQKDAQQVSVVRQLVRDLNLPLEIVACPTVREADGLAMSSRNALLDPSERQRAVALYRALNVAQELVSGGERRATTILAAAAAALAQASLDPDYLALVDPSTFAAVSSVDGPTLALVAARVGSVRLIDNQLLV